MKKPVAPQRQHGFTLLKIMVIVVMLAGLTSLIMPDLMRNNDRTDRQTTVRKIVPPEYVLELYRLDNNRNPATEQALPARVEKPEMTPLPRSYRSEGYLRRLPDDPRSSPYRLVASNRHGSPDIFSPGPARLPDTEDDSDNRTLDNHAHGK